jgi:abhydrolase domain-containing protein 14
MRRRAALLPLLAALAALLSSRPACAAPADGNGSEERLLSVPLPADVTGAPAETFRVRALVSASTASQARSAPVLLLHGASFNADTWATLGTLKLLSAAGYATAAIDLPGAMGGGTTPSGRVPLQRRGALLVGVLDALDWRTGTVHVVAPSASGRFALPMLLRAPERVASFVPVAAVGLEGTVEKMLMEAESARALPTLLVYGERDSPDGLRAQHFKQTFPDAEKARQSSAKAAKSALTFIS